MKAKGLVLTAALVILTNAVLLALVAFNRSGDPEATVELTERELRLTPGDSENTGVVLTLAWSAPFDLGSRQGVQYPWFDRAKLESVGFDCRLPLDDPSAERFYQTQSMLSRPAFAVLEYGGEAWQQALERELAQAERNRQDTDKGVETAEAIKERTDNAIARRSRLVVVDVGPNARDLRLKYPDRARFLVLRSFVSLVYLAKPRGASGEGPGLTGTVANVLPDTIYVPRELRAPGDVLSMKPAPDEWPGRLLKHDPRYRVTLAFGKKLEPRVVKVQAGI